MKSKITKLTTAAVIVIAVMIGINHLGGSIDGATVAWGDVVTRVDRLDYVHVYWLKSRGNNFIRHSELWYDHGKLVTCGNKGEMIYDDGQIEQGFNEQGRRTTKGPSIFANGQTFLELVSAGLLSDDNEQLNQQIPDNVGDDFLVYEFDPPKEHPHSDDIESVSITVGRNSLLPVQMKIYEKDSNDYDLVMFDYEAAEKPAEFFEPPTVDMPNGGKSEIVLDGEEIMIDIEGSPGIKTAIVRLHGKYDGPLDQLPSNYRRMLARSFRKTYERKGGPIFKLDVTFITDEGYRSSTNDVIVLWLNEGKKCGVGSENGGVDNWPDGKYRNIKFSPVLKPTDREDTYIIEMNCWLRPKDK
ncbi:hypothetical protein ACFL3G_07930 [Planctomycetota bacterium]